jgi:hypothetical protein
MKSNASEPHRPGGFATKLNDNLVFVETAIFSQQNTRQLWRVFLHSK